MADRQHQYQRIASAIYLITSFFADLEPLKWKLRALSADLVSEGMKDKALVAREIGHLFALTRSAGIVSETNHAIVAGQLARLEEESSLALDFPAPLPELKPKPTPVEAPWPVAEIKDKTPEPKPSLKEFGAVSVKKNNRQSVIIGLLKRKREIMIKDVTPLIPGVSEKTIQRELLEMVAAGILTKIGEKRWPRYTLAP